MSQATDLGHNGRVPFTRVAGTSRGILKQLLGEIPSSQFTQGQQSVLLCAFFLNVGPQQAKVGVLSDCESRVLAVCMAKR